MALLVAASNVAASNVVASHTSPPAAARRAGDGGGGACCRCGLLHTSVPFQPSPWPPPPANTLPLPPAPPAPPRASLSPPPLQHTHTHTLVTTYDCLRAPHLRSTSTPAASLWTPTLWRPRSAAARSTRSRPSASSLPSGGGPATAASQVGGTCWPQPRCQAGGHASDPGTHARPPKPPGPLCAVQQPRPFTHTSRRQCTGTTTATAAALPRCTPSRYLSSSSCRTPTSHQPHPLPGTCTHACWVTPHAGTTPTVVGDQELCLTPPHHAACCCPPPPSPPPTHGRRQGAVPHQR